jgi:hypothetical protein
MFRFTIRDVLWLTVVVGLVWVWWRERVRVDKDRRECNWNVRALTTLIEGKGFVVRNDKRGMGIREFNGPWSSAMSRNEESD